MRIDKFLKLSRLIKRREVAREMTDAGAVRLNGRKVKPAAEVKTGDAIEVAFPRRVVSVSVLTADEREMKRGGPSVSIEGETRLNEDEKPW
ncbi:MAG: RNA-binding S4 domain-containing protein [Synergistaceae bacterium]|jgi:ribosomal 50S subunit-recycling heat shock protein|nr:RNA-binding S4 domain-containing protein [Synergistaceae bacterium]